MLNSVQKTRSVQMSYLDSLEKNQQVSLPFYIFWKCKKTDLRSNVWYSRKMLNYRETFDEKNYAALDSEKNVFS